MCKRFRLLTTKKLKNPYWRFNNLLNENEVNEFLKGTKDLALLQKVSFYILAHVENLTLQVLKYLRVNLKKEDADKHLEFTKPIIRKLRKIYKEIHKTNDVKKVSSLIDEMVSICLEVGIDPF